MFNKWQKENGKCSYHNNNIGINCVFVDLSLSDVASFSQFVKAQANFANGGARMMDPVLGQKFGKMVLHIVKSSQSSGRENVLKIIHP